jgi:hypothetical protein
MKRTMVLTMVVTLIGALAMPVLAQPRPGGPGGGPGRGPMGAGDGPGEGIGPYAGPGAGGPMRPELMKLQMLREYVDVVNGLTHIAHDPTSSGVAAVVAASDLLRARGTDASIQYFTKLLPDVKNDAVQRAIRIQLVDLYRQSGQADKALEQLDLLIKGAPAGAAPSGDTPAPPTGR